MSMYRRHLQANTWLPTTLHPLFDNLEPHDAKILGTYYSRLVFAMKLCSDVYPDRQRVGENMLDRMQSETGRLRTIKGNYDGNMVLLDRIIDGLNMAKENKAGAVAMFRQLLQQGQPGQ